MIKGVNRHMIELTDVDNEYYERAFLVIKPQYESIERILLDKEAKKVIKELGSPSMFRRKKRILPKILRIVLPFAFGAAISLAVMFFLKP